VTEVTHASIQLMNATGNLRAMRNSLRKSQWMESNAFWRSIFKIHMEDMFFLW